MKIFNKNEAPTEWFCQSGNGCILFALINSGKLSSRLFSWLKPNENPKSKSLEDQVLFKLRVMAVWVLVTGYYPFDQKETFYTIYLAFMKLRSKKGKMSEHDYKKCVCHCARKISELEKLFANHDERSLNNGTWDAGRRMKLKAEDFTSLEDLPYKSLISIESSLNKKVKHWVVYLGADGDDAIALDSLLYDGYKRIPVSELEGQKITKPKNIKISPDLYKMLLDFDTHPKEVIRNLRRREFSRKIAEYIGRLKQINFAAAR